MPLAPRPALGTDRASVNPTTGQKRDSGLGKEGKARQRERNKDSDTAHLTNSGSSGKAKSIAQLPKIDFESVLPSCIHVCDVAGKITHSQLGGNAWATSSLAVPIEYVHDLIEAHGASQRGLVFIRVYTIDMEAYMNGEQVGNAW